MMPSDVLTPISLTYVQQLLPMASICVPAGFPSPAADHEEDEVDPIAWIVRHPSATFWWRVSGDSLVDEGIFDGDLIAVDRAGKKRVGRIVLAVVEGAVTVKKLAKREGRYWLDPKSRGRDFTPILVTENTEIWGVVAGIVRRYPVE
ncbi:peptidase S24 [Brucella ciceri]|uniref:LexA family protein n=1 Tax=Brucella ciceri TaxID=391287 RepID=UPI000DD50EA8|nr:MULTISPECIES: S24 family peptidase [Brucella]MCH6206647.1 peptidase S24 [Brucella ciceri]